MIQSGPVYLVATARRGEPTIEQQAVASAALPADFKLSAERGRLMRDMGFKKRGGGRRNWVRVHGRDEVSLGDQADAIVDILERVYGAVDSPELEITQDDNDHPENPDLMASMREVAKGWDEAKRRAMYTELVNATFLVPLVPDVADDVDDAEALHTVDLDPRGGPILGAFTDWHSLRLWEPRGWPYLALHGSDLFELVLSRKPTGFRVNPNGDVGGELYLHEVEMLVRAVRSFRRQHSN